ncbi:MAG: XRE family transcriptional regulator [Deltaproteobacteria bacterium]|nr:XRE family transcriptional regulator [Deltaproteobacteria bacterium]
MLSGDRFRQAREIRGWTQTELARRIGVYQSAIAQFEGGMAAPSQEKLQAIAFQTGFPIAFFRQGFASDFPLGSLLFRAKASLSSGDKNRLRQYGKIIYESVEKMEVGLSKIPLRLPRQEGDPEAAARITRSVLGLPPDDPVDLLIRPIEMTGVLVLAIPMDIDKYDAFSLWLGKEAQRPVMVFSARGPGDRLRFNIAHELGHLVLHHAVDKDIRTMEKEANRFASELLMPREAMMRELVPPVTLMSLRRLGLRWKVSVQALIRRARDLEITSQRQYVYLNQQLNKLGLRKKSLVDILIERPRAFRQMAEMLYGDPIDCRKMASEMNLPHLLVLEAVGRYAEKNRAWYPAEVLKEANSATLVDLTENRSRRGKMDDAERKRK